MATQDGVGRVADQATVDAHSFGLPTQTPVVIRHSRDTTIVSEEVLGSALIEGEEPTE